jgi:hypothetical protein
MTRSDLEARLRQAAHDTEFPPTPDIASRVIVRLPARGHRIRSLGPLAWFAAALLALMLSLLLVPSARAALINYLQIGVVRIFLADGTPTETSLPTLAPHTAVPGTATLAPLRLPTSNPLIAIAGETSLSDLKQIVPYPVLVPTYPSSLGVPDHVYVQDANGPVTLLVWEVRDQPGQVLLTLGFVPSGSWVIEKSAPKVVEETTVNGLPAVWAEGPYPLIMRNGQVSFTRLVLGNVLIWTEHELTLRLETAGSLSEAVKIAESLEPLR